MTKPAHRSARTAKSDLTGDYDLVAREYYDIERHPTCRNFRDASLRFLKSVLLDLDCTGVNIEVGSGASILAEALSGIGVSLAATILADASLTMLAYSDHFIAAGAQPTIADATSMPFASGTAALIVASLGDPYNVPEFWAEVERCLARTGRCVFTTPSFEWASHFRRRAPDELESCAYFELRDGSSVYVPSIIHATRDQVALVRRHGFEVEAVRNIPARELPQPLSAKLKASNGRLLDPVTGYLLRKL